MPTVADPLPLEDFPFKPTDGVRKMVNFYDIIKTYSDPMDEDAVAIRSSR